MLTFNLQAVVALATSLLVHCPQFFLLHYIHVTMLTRLQVFDANSEVNFTTAPIVTFNLQAVVALATSLLVQYSQFLLLYYDYVTNLTRLAETTLIAP